MTNKFYSSIDGIRIRVASVMHRCCHRSDSVSFMSGQSVLPILLLCLTLFIGAGQMWGDPIHTLDFTAKTASNSTYNQTYWTYGSWSVNQCANNSKSWAYVRCGGKGGSGNNSTSTFTSNFKGPKIESKVGSIVISHNGRNNDNVTNTSVTITAYSNSTYTTSIWTATRSSNSITIATSTADTIQFTGLNIAKDSYYIIQITSTVKGKNNIGVDVTKVEFYAPASFTITPASNNTSYGTVAISDGVITASPKSGYRVSTSTPYSISPANSATVEQSGNAFTVTPSANTTVTINFEAIPLCTVTLKDDNSTLTQASAGASVTLPTRTGCTGYTFAGWSTTNNTTWTTTQPTIINAGSYTPTADINLYPVYTKEDSGEGFTGYSKVTTALSDWSGQYLISDGTNTADGGNLSSTALSITAFTPGATEKSEYEFTFVKNGNNNNYYILLPDGETYLGGASSGANLALTTNTNNLTNYYLWTFSKDDPMSTNVGNSRYIGVGVQSSTDCFKAYSTSGTNAKCYLYKRNEGSTTVTSYISVSNCCTPLVSINGSFNRYHLKIFHHIIMSMFISLIFKC